MTCRAVFDCMVFLQGAGRPTSPARACFRAVEDGDVTLFLSHDILAEVRDVLTRPKTQQRFPLLSAAWVSEFLQSVESKAVVVPDVPKLFSLDRDPKDEPYINLAIAAQVRFLVSRDLDLLDLMNDAKFRAQFPDLLVVDPVAFLKVVSQEKLA